MPDTYQRHAGQFGLNRLLELVTISSLLLALTPIVGIVAGLALSLAAAGLMLRLGPLTVFMLAAAVIGTGIDQGEPLGDDGLGRHLLTIAAALLVCLWYSWRSRQLRSSPMPITPAHSRWLPETLPPWSDPH